MISVAKLRRFRGWKMGKLGEMLDPLETKQIHGSKSTKLHQTNRSQKNFGAIFGGDFRNWGRTQQKQARKRWRGLQIHEKPWLLIPYDAGWNPNQQIFHVWRVSHVEHGEYKAETGENTRETHKNKSNHISTRQSNTQDHTVHEQQRERYKVKFISKRRS